MQLIGFIVIAIGGFILLALLPTLLKLLKPIVAVLFLITIVSGAFGIGGAFLMPFAPYIAGVFFVFLILMKISSLCGKGDD